MLVAMKFPMYIKFALFAALIALNFVIRIPSVPHEIGYDSYTIHILANSVSFFGYAKWWLNTWSVFGLYPNSYASAIPFALSGVSQCCGVDIESSIWLFSVCIGLLSIFAIYCLSGMLWDNDVFKFLTAFVFSTSPGILAFSTWDASTRGGFIIVLPIFLYLLFKFRSSYKYGILALIITIYLAATHHLFLILIPIIFIFILVTCFGTLNIFNFKYISDNLINIAYMCSFIGAFLFPFFSRLFIEWGRYDQLYLIVNNIVRYNGIAFFLAISGFIYLSLKNNKSFNEWLFLLIVLVLTPLLYIESYSHFLILPFVCLLTSVALTNISKIKQNKIKVFSALVIIILLSTSFSGFYQHWRTKSNVGIGHLDEITYSGALWIGNNIDKDNRLIGNNHLLLRKIFAVSEVPSILLEAEDVMLVYGFVNATNVNIIKNSPWKKGFYLNNPYVTDSKEVGWNINYIQDKGINSWWGNYILSKYDFSYVIQDMNWGVNQFIHSLYNSKNIVYDNGGIRVWKL